MSQANVEIVRQFVLVDLEEALTYADPEIIWNPIEEPPTQGHDAVRANLARWEGAWDDYTLRDGKIIRMDEFTDRAEALEAAGPPE